MRHADLEGWAAAGQLTSRERLVNWIRNGRGEFRCDERKCHFPVRKNASATKKRRNILNRSPRPLLGFCTLSTSRGKGHTPLAIDDIRATFSVSSIDTPEENETRENVGQAVPYRPPSSINLQFNAETMPSTQQL